LKLVEGVNVAEGANLPVEGLNVVEGVNEVEAVEAEAAAVEGVVVGGVVLVEVAGGFTSVGGGTAGVVVVGVGAVVAGACVGVPNAGVAEGLNVEVVADVEELLLSVLGANEVAKLNDVADPKLDDPDPKVEVPKLNDVAEPNGLAAGGLKVEEGVDVGAVEEVAAVAAGVVDVEKGLGPVGVKENWVAEPNGLAVPNVDGAAAVFAAGFAPGKVPVKGAEAGTGVVGVAGVALKAGGVAGAGPMEREVDEPKEREVEEPNAKDEEEPEGLNENAGAVAADAGVGAGLCLGGIFAMTRLGNFATGG
jgi:hypothetical protein